MFGFHSVCNLWPSKRVASKASLLVEQTCDTNTKH